jgi:hypothetical protein
MAFMDRRSVNIRMTDALAERSEPVIHAASGAMSFNGGRFSGNFSRGPLTRRASVEWRKRVESG